MSMCVKCAGSCQICVSSLDILSRVGSVEYQVRADLTQHSELGPSHFPFQYTHTLSLSHFHSHTLSCSFICSLSLSRLPFMHVLGTQ